MNAHQGACLAAQWSPDGAGLLTGTYDSVIENPISYYTNYIRQYLLKVLFEIPGSNIVNYRATLRRFMVFSW